MKINVVDDEKFVLKLMSRLLLRDGHEVATYDSGVAFLEDWLTNDGPDVLLLDIVMPVKDGTEVFLEMLASGRPMPKVIFISAYDITGRLNAFLKTDEVWYLPKPFEIEALRNLLDYIAGKLGRARRCQSTEYLGVPRKDTNAIDSDGIK